MAKIACQTIVFGGDLKDRMDSIWRTVASVGYSGVEVGARHLYLERPEYYRELLSETDLELVAVHVGGDFLNPASVAQQLAAFDATVAFAQALGSPYIYLSGNNFSRKTVEDYKKESKVYNDLGRRCRDAGMKLCYHNHDWEMVNQMAGMKVLLRETDPDLVYLVPDVGWLTVANVNPVQFLSENIERVEALHFKEFQPIRQFSELGTGMVDFPAIYRWAVSRGRDFWISAEQDETRLTPAESAAINYAYIKRLVEGQ